MFRIFFISFSFLVINVFGNVVFAVVDVSDDATQYSQPNTSKSNNHPAAATGPGKLSTKLNLAENNPVAALLCKGIRAFTGTVAKIIAVLMLIGLGISLLSATQISPVTPVTFMAVIIAVSILFSSEYLVGRLMGDSGKGGVDGMKACDCKYGLDQEYCKPSKS